MNTTSHPLTSKYAFSHSSWTLGQRNFELVTALYWDEEEAAESRYTGMLQVNGERVFFEGILAFSELVEAFKQELTGRVTAWFEALKDGGEGAMSCTHRKAHTLDYVASLYAPRSKKQ